ncbi:NUDIX hydrolase [Candidatus Poribacteria bacterium]|nr:NUDIX hydrolase [Candidatus Poribacteria bacterium]
MTIDIVLLTDAFPHPKVLLIRRKNPPFKDLWALPGGFLEMDETLEESACRELHEETNISDVQLTQVGTFGRPDRDPRGRVITVAYVGIIGSEQQEAIAGSDAAEVSWFPTLDMPQLAFDHSEIIKKALEGFK